MRRQFFERLLVLLAVVGLTAGVFAAVNAFTPDRVAAMASTMEPPIVALQVPEADMPNPEYRIPPGELAPGDVVIMSEAGDTPDWGHATIGVPDAWKVTKGKGVVVAVLDTGCDGDHRDLKGRIKATKDFTGSRSGWADVQGHGTHCAGVVLAAENGVGMVGVAPEAQLLVGKVLDDRGSGLSTWIAAGIDWAVEQGADVISMSLGSPAADARIHAAVKRAVDKGVIVVAAAGNEGPREGTIGYPGGLPECICVGAVDSNLKTANFSSRGARLDVAAPGVNVRSCYPGDRFATMSGTSMATPYVAGCAALYVAYERSRFGTPNPKDFRKLIEATSKDLPPAGRDHATGAGLIQPTKLVQGGKPFDPVDPIPGGSWAIEIPKEHRGKPIKRIVVEFDDGKVAPVQPRPDPPFVPRPILPEPAPELCPGGVCPVPSAGPPRRGWYPGKLLGR